MSATVKPFGPPGLLSWQMHVLAFALGLLASVYPLPAAVCLGLAWASARLLRNSRPVFAVFILAFVLGWGYASWRMPVPPDSTPEFILSRTKVELSGRIDAVDFRAGDRARVLLADARCALPDGSVETLPGRVALTWDYPPARPMEGQFLTALVRIKPVTNFGNPGMWNFALYWRCRDVFYRTYLGAKAKGASLSGPPAPLSRLREAVVERVEPLIPQSPGGDILKALILGDRSGMDIEIEDEVRSTGLAHTLALSGLHVGFVAGLGVVLAWLLGFAWPGLLLAIPRPKLAVMAAAPLVFGYAWIGGFTPSLLRASIMFGAWGVLLLLNRERVLLDGLFLAIALILAASPLSVFDLGLQLSVMAVAGIAVFLPLFGGLRLGGGGLIKWIANGVLGTLLVSLGANLGILPLQMWFFGEVTPNILVNVYWLPILGLAVMPLGLGGFLFGLVPWTSGLGRVLLGAASWILDRMLAGLDAQSGWGVLPRYAVYRPDWVQIAGWYLLLLGVAAGCAAALGPARERSARKRAWILSALGAVLMIAPVLAGIASGFGKPPRVELAMLDVGQGQSILITSPTGERWLVDGGGLGSKRFDIGRAVVGPYLTMGRLPRLDGVVLTHGDADHSTGLAHIIDEFAVKGFYHNGREPDGQGVEELLDLAAARETPGRVLSTGDSLDLGGGLSLRVVHPAVGFNPRNDNDVSLVLRLEWNGKGLALVCGDIQKDGIAELLKSGVPLNVDLLVAPHHGSKSSLSPELYARTAPRAFFVSAGYLNHYGFPHARVRAAVEAVGATVLDTGSSGELTAVWEAGQDKMMVKKFNIEELPRAR